MVEWWVVIAIAVGAFCVGFVAGMVVLAFWTWCFDDSEEVDED